MFKPSITTRHFQGVPKRGTNGVEFNTCGCLRIDAPGFCVVLSGIKFTYVSKLMRGSRTAFQLDNKLDLTLYL